ncbi:hypothetical protein, partial [Streptomyces sp. NPDC055990]|uniref:hypothetical protein n=1 Tax=Streptomyces sp. NPDC055990 TaxID=3345672 RepID=UPI0035DB4A08
MASLDPLKYGKVVGRFLANISDGPDIEDLPEFPPLQGTLTFTAGAPKVLVATAEPKPATYVQLPEYYKVSLDEFGYITWRGERGVKLVAPTEDTTNPSGWTWKVTFDLNYEGTPVPIAPFAFNVPEYIPGPDEEDPDEDSEGLVDLTLASPVPASNGEAVVRGLSVVDVELIGNALEFILDNGEHLDPVTIPQIEAAQDAADAAAASETAAETAASDAQAAVNSFDLSIGDVTTVPNGTPADATVSGGPPAWTLNLVLPAGPEGPAGSNDWDEITDKPTTFPPTIGSGAGDAVAGNDTRLTDARTPTSHTHPASQISDSTSVGRSVLTATDAAAARTAISAVSSGDSRLTDTRTPTVGTSPYDVCFPAFGKDTTRAASSAGDLPGGLKLQRAVTFSSVTYRAVTADASGNLVCE